MTTDLATLSARLRVLIDADGRPHYKIAEAAGLSRADFSRAQNGVVDPRWTTVAKILGGLGKQWKDLDQPTGEMQCNRT